MWPWCELCHQYMWTACEQLSCKSILLNNQSDAAWWPVLHMFICFYSAQPFLKYGNRGIKKKEIKCENSRGRRKALTGYHGTWAQRCCRSINITEGPFAFDPTLPDTGCSSSTSWQDQHLAVETQQPPEKIEKHPMALTQTHIQDLIYNSMMKYMLSLAKSSILWMTCSFLKYSWKCFIVISLWKNVPDFVKVDKVKSDIYGNWTCHFHDV